MNPARMTLETALRLCADKPLGGIRVDQHGQWRATWRKPGTRAVRTAKFTTWWDAATAALGYQVLPPEPDAETALWEATNDRH